MRGPWYYSADPEVRRSEECPPISNGGTQSASTSLALLTRQVPVTARRVSVGIVNHNGESYLLQTLRAVARLGPAVDDVLLIDSGSTDGGVRARAGAFPPRAGDRAGRQPRPGRGPQSSHQGGGARPGPADRQRRRAATRQRGDAGRGPRWPLQRDPGDGGGALRAGARHGPVCRRRAALPGHAGAAPGGYARGAAGGRRARGGDGHHLLRDGGPGALRRPAVVRRAPLLLSGGP